MKLTNKSQNGERLVFTDDDLKRLKDHARLPTRDMIMLSHSQTLAFLARLEAAEARLEDARLTLQEIETYPKCPKGCSCGCSDGMSAIAYEWRRTEGK